MFKRVGKIFVTFFTFSICLFSVAFAAVVVVDLNGGTTNLSSDADLVSSVTTDGSSGFAADTFGAYQWSYDGTNLMKLNIPFNTGATQTDYSGNTVNGTVSEAVFHASTSGNCKIGGCMHFDGINDYVNVGSSILLNPNEFTVETWIKPEAGMTNDRFFSYNPTTNGAISKYLSLYITGTVVSWDIYTDLGWAAIGGDYLTIGSWSHIVAVYDGLFARFYVDGVEVGVYDFATQGSTYIAYGGAFNTYIGANANSPTNGPFKGYMDDFRIYNTALTGPATNCTANSNNEICSLFNTGTSGLSGPTTIVSGETTVPEVWNLSISTVSSTGLLLQADVSGNTVTITTPVVNNYSSVISTSIDSSSTEINLIENTTTTVSCVATITDGDGFADIISVKAELHRSSVSAGSSDDNNNHYTLSGDTECIPSNGSGNTEDYTCDFAVYYYADPTDAGAYISDDWECLITPTDGDGVGGTGSDTIEMNSLSALNVTANVAHGALSINSDTGATNQITTITNTGNINIDIEISGTDLSCSSGAIAVDNQKFDISDVNYSVLVNTLSTVAVEYNYNMSQQTNDLVESTKDLYWGLAIPSQGAGGTCVGIISFVSVADIAVD